ncbi:MAG: hypothetical protein ACK4NM_19205, partial [Hydrogenophaga sp.]
MSDDEDATKQRQSWMMAPPTDRPSVLPASTADMRSRTFSIKGREPGKVRCCAAPRPCGWVR